MARLGPFSVAYLALFNGLLLAFAPLFWLVAWPFSYKLSLFIVTLLLAWGLLRKGLSPLTNAIEALKIGLLNFKDGEFSNTLSYEQGQPFSDLCALYNQSAHRLGQEKRWIYQRELMLDKVLHSAPQVLLLVNDRQQIVFSNYAARDLFELGHQLEGQSLVELLNSAPEGLRQALHQDQEGLFTLLPANQERQTWHLAKGQFVLNNQFHTLYILKQMTRELSRQEVAVWKKVIRIISHELNNSIGPISSMLHSGQILSNNVDEPRLARVFATIAERIAHLTEFVQGYGKFAKLPEPKPTKINVVAFIQQLQQQWQFDYQQQGDGTLVADQVQLEQLMINLLKNAHESDSDPNDIQVKLHLHKNFSSIEVCDGGKGMTEQVLSQALIPFYSTKTSGSGLGLALCREIAEAHHGHIALQNRPTHGLIVRVWLPVPTQ